MLKTNVHKNGWRLFGAAFPVNLIMSCLHANEHSLALLWNLQCTKCLMWFDKPFHYFNFILFNFTALFIYFKCLSFNH